VQDVPVVAHALQDTGAEILEQDVRTGHQFVEGGPVAGGLEVEFDRLLPGVLGEEGCADAGGVEPRLRAEPAGEVTMMRLLDFDDLGSEQHQLIAAVRSGQYIGQIHHPYAAQRSVVHALPLGR
jgi:hypothetical protein